ncbi:FAD:protein FMN transferase [Clostridium sp.]|jgi:FAD:protein FMN transferase|uniref:FAD:protein FMN transferase n=1 Tax=Clostridium sp. TaxID=1506 RepID=UPI0039F50BBB
MNNIKKVLLVLTMFISTISMVACTKNNSSEPISRTNLFMGTVVKISLYDKKDQNIISKGFDRIEQIESEVSINEQGTELDKVNQAAGKTPVKVKDDTLAITKKGLEYSELAKGSFDITVGPIVKLWSIGLPEAKVPTQSEIDEKLKLVGYKDLQLNEKDKTIFLKKKGMIIDLGAIAKGYTADAVAEVLKNEGVKSAIIDLGGNVFALGTKPDGDLWKIGIQNPFQSRGEIVGTIYVENKSIVTSGIYERFIEKDGKKYHHILNPFTGYPYDNEIAGVTIVSDKSIDGDALSTSVFSKGLKGGMDFIESIKDVDAIFITKDKKVYVTKGIKDNFKITNDDFTLMN